MEVVGVELSHGDKFALLGNHVSSRCLVDILLLLLLLLLMCLISSHELNGGVPPKLPSWKEKDIVQGRIEWVHFRNALERTMLAIEDDVTSILRLISISRKDDGNLI